MCLIVDASVAGELTKTTADKTILEVRKWLLGPKGRMACGGANQKELRKCQEFWERIAKVLNQAGRMVSPPQTQVEDETDRVKRCGLCLSNDHHVIALARITGAHLLCTGENTGNLPGDFKNKKLVHEGKVIRPGTKCTRKVLQRCPRCKVGRGGTCVNLPAPVLPTSPRGKGRPKRGKKRHDPVHAGTKR